MSDEPVPSVCPEGVDHGRVRQIADGIPLGVAFDVAEKLIDRRYLLGQYERAALSVLVDRAAQNAEHSGQCKNCDHSSCSRQADELAVEVQDLNAEICACDVLAVRAELAALRTRVAELRCTLDDLWHWADEHRVSRSGGCTSHVGDCYEEWSLLSGEVRKMTAGGADDGN